MFLFILRYQRQKKLEEKQSSGRIPEDAAAPNPAYEHTDPLYSEIGGVDRHVNPLPFTPDPTLQLGLQTNGEPGYRCSTDSGLYSEPTDLERIAGRGALDVPSIMRISNSSLSRMPDCTNQAPIMTPMTPDEIDALYAKPNKVKRKGQPPQGPAQSQGPNHLFPSQSQAPPFRPIQARSHSHDALHIPPPLATGSRSNSASNIYHNAPLTLAPPGPLHPAISGNLNGMQQNPTSDLSVGEMYMTDNTHTSSQNSLNASRGTIETDV